MSSPTKTHTSPSIWGTTLTSPHRQPARAPHSQARSGVDPPAAPAGSPKESDCPSPSPMPSPAPPSVQSDCGFRTCRQAARRRATRLPRTPRPRHPDQHFEGADQIRLDHPRPVPGQAVHRVVEQQFNSCCGSGWIPTRGSAPQPPGARRHPARHAALRDHATVTVARQQGAGSARPAFIGLSVGLPQRGGWWDSSGSQSASAYQDACALSQGPES